MSSECSTEIDSGSSQEIDLVSSMETDSGSSTEIDLGSSTEIDDDGMHFQGAPSIGKDALVLGAGYAGVMTAWQLRQEGYDVRVIERHKEPALEASFMNGGLLCPSLTYPWSNLGVFKMILTGSEAVEIKRKAWFETFFWKWSWAFLKSLREFDTNYHRSWELSNYSLGLMSKIVPDDQYSRLAKGSIQLFQDQGKRDSVFRRMQNAMPDEVIKKCDQADLVDKAPLLKLLKKNPECGIWSMGDSNGDIHQYTTKAVNILKKNGVEFSYETEVVKLNLDKKLRKCTGATLRSLDDGQEVAVHADQVIVACGNGANEFAHAAGDRILSYPVQGYIFNIGVNPGFPALEQNIVDDFNHVYTSPLFDYKTKERMIRVSGVCRMGGENSHNDVPYLGNPQNSSESSNRDARSESLLDDVRAFFPDGYLNEQEIKHHRCYRPQTPDDLPVIGPSSFYKNLWYNAGHGHIGWTRGFASAQLLSDQICGRTPAIEYECYHPYRFLPWWGKLSEWYNRKRWGSSSKGASVPSLVPTRIPSTQGFSFEGASLPSLPAWIRDRQGLNLWGASLPSVPKWIRDRQGFSFDGVTLPILRTWIRDRKEE